MTESDPYRDLKKDIARIVATGSDPTEKGFRRAFTEEFGYAPPPELMDYFHELTAPQANDTVELSLAAMVTVALFAPPSIEIPGAPLVIDVSVSTTSSMGSTMLSVMTSTRIVLLLVPAVIVTDPLRATKSLPEVAVPPTV